MCCQCAVQRAAPIEFVNAATKKWNDKSDEAVIDDFYFDADPELFICSHFPTESDTKGQIDPLLLLERPFSMFDFAKAPLLTSALPALGLEMASENRKSILNVTDAVNDLIVSLLWKSNECYMNGVEGRLFRYLLVPHDSSSSTDESNRSSGNLNSSLTDYCMFEISDKGIQFSLRFPQNGLYRFVVFASSEQEQIFQQSMPNANTSEAGRAFRQRKSSSYLLPTASSFVPLCEWLLEVDKPPVLVMRGPFPKCQVSQTWGLPPHVPNRFGVLNKGVGAKVYTDDNGVAEIRLRMTKPCVFQAKLKLKDETNPPGTYIFHRIAGRSAIFTICVPLVENSEIEYGFELFANDPEVDGRTLFALAQFLVIGPFKPLGEPAYCSKQLSLFSAPTSTVLGPHQSMSESGLFPLSHVDPMIVRNTSKELELTFGKEDDVSLRFIIALYLCKSGSNNQVVLQDLSLFTLLQTVNRRKIKLVCRFPVGGVYKLQIFAAKVGSNLDIPIVFTYAIFANRKSPSSFPFPKQLSPWFGGTLVEPKVGYLNPATLQTSPNSSQQFKVIFPTARKIALVVKTVPRERFVLLNKVSQTDGTDCWCGLLSLDAAEDAEIAVMANLESDADESSFCTLLIFNTSDIKNVQSQFCI